MYTQEDIDPSYSNEARDEEAQVMEDKIDNVDAVEYYVEDFIVQTQYSGIAASNNDESVQILEDASSQESFPEKSAENRSVPTIIKKV